jgi:hypothetical protein
LKTCINAPELREMANTFLSKVLGAGPGIIKWPRSAWAFANRTVLGCEPHEDV